VGSTDKVLDIELSYHNSSLCAFFAALITLASVGRSDRLPLY
jgi:hypothetical protein